MTSEEAPRSNTKIDDVGARLAIARDLAARWLRPRGRRDKRASLGLVLSIAKLAGVGDDAGVAEVEVEYLIEELLRRGRREDEERVTPDDLITAGLRAAP